MLKILLDHGLRYNSLSLLTRAIDNRNINALELLLDYGAELSPTHINRVLTDNTLPSRLRSIILTKIDTNTLTTFITMDLDDRIIRYIQRLINSRQK